MADAVAAEIAKDFSLKLVQITGLFLDISENSRKYGSTHRFWSKCTIFDTLDTIKLGKLPTCLGQNSGPYRVLVMNKKLFM